MGIKRYIISRVTLSIPFLLILLFVIFFAFRILPGDPARLVAGEKASEELVDEIRHEMGLDRPIGVQFFDYLRQMLTGDLGVSLRTGNSVIKAVSYGFGATLELTVFSMIMGVALGFLTGITSAFKRGGVIDQTLRVLSLGVYSIPIFLIGMAFQYVLGLHLGIFPIGGRGGIGMTSITGLHVLDSILQLNFSLLIESISCLVLPSLTGGLFLMPRIGRVLRTSIVNEMSEGYIITARAKGVPEILVVVKHALRNSLLPTIAVIGLTFGGFLGGMVILETVFSIPGIGRLLIKSVLARDFPLIQGILLMFAIIIVVVNTITDIISSVVDPRIVY